MVKFIETKLTSLRDEVVEMWSLVHSQMQQACTAVMNVDRKVALQIAVRERRVDAFDLKIDSDIEDYIALFSPVAIDLRFVLALFKINNDLERIGDYADGIARFVGDVTTDTIDPRLLRDLRLREMFHTVLSMLSSLQQAFINEDVNEALTVLAQDDTLDTINRAATPILVAYAQQNPSQIPLCLALGGVIRKLERTGDHMTNIVEEIVFYVDAKVLRHAHKLREREQPGNEQ